MNNRQPVNGKWILYFIRWGGSVLALTNLCYTGIHLLYV